MTLSRKVSLIVVIAFLVSGLLSFIIQQIFIMPSFVNLEKETAIQNTERALEAIKRELDQITPSVSDWAYWTDTYEYVKGERPNYAEENLIEGATLDGLSVNYMGLYNVDGQSVWSEAIDLNNGEAIELGLLTGKELRASHPLLQHKNLDSVKMGIVHTAQAPMLVVAKPILTNDKKGPIAGTFILGRLLDGSAIERISNTIKLPLHVSPSTEQSATSNWIGAAAGNTGLIYTELNPIATEDNWQVGTTIGDIFGLPILDLSVKTSRKISAQGAVAVGQSLWVLAVTGMLVMLFLWLMLKRTVLQPISTLTDHAVRIGKNDDLQSRLELKRKDEVGVLANTFDQMVDRLADTRRRLIDQSYHSGISEMASGVLHNIGNAITPLNIRLSKLQQGFNSAPLAEVELATVELADQSTQQERRADLTQFVELAATEMAGLIKSGQKEVERSVQQIVQIQEILNDQQRFSRSARVIEPVEMSALINEVEGGLLAETKDLLSIEISPDVAEHGPVAGVHVALQQVVSNILINAAEAIQATGKEKGKLVISAVQEKLDGQTAVKLSFTDNGTGLAPDEPKLMFERGYSTKSREGSGYGLHWSANTVQALGGRITAENAKNGTGACIHVFLPLAENKIDIKADKAKDFDGLQN